MAQPDLLAPGTVFAGDYTIVRPLSEGGMGALYVVQQRSTGAQRALKLMHAQLLRDPRLRQRFEQEARVGARIESDHVVQVLGAGVDEPTGMPWLVMELLVGQDLSAVIEQRGPLPPAEVRDVFAQFTHAVAAAHRVGVVHRDLKPENIFLAVAQREGASHFVKVLDFGIAKVVAEANSSFTQALGTPVWMAPEQTEPGRSITPAADVWALGLIAFRMLTGKYYWVSANSEQATPTMVLREAVIDPLVSASDRAQQYGCRHLLPFGFDLWFARCVARSLDARFENAGQAREAFAEVMQRSSAAPPTPPAVALPPAYGPVPAYTPAPVYTQPVHQAPIAPPPPTVRDARRRRSPVLIGAALAGVVALGAGALVMRAALRAQDASDCESGKKEGLLAACRAACDADPKKYCVIHGDLLRAKGDAESLARAAKRYAKACEAEAFLGCRKLGSLREVGIEGAVEKDAAKALADFQKSCDGGSASGCAYLGRRLERGRGIPRDAARAVGLYRSACSGDDPAACAFLGFAEELRPPPRPEAGEIAALHQKASAALERECASGGLVECLILGYLREVGSGVPRDPSAAAELYRKACAGGLPEGCTNEAALEITGPDAARNASKASESLRKACSAGALAACDDLAILQTGVPFTLRHEQGERLFRPTCGDVVSLGCTSNGAEHRPPAGIARDLPGAAVLLQQACAGGLGMACENLGALQESGVGMAKAPAQAQSAYEKACAAGASEGCATMRDAPFQAGEVWSGSYACGQGSTDLALRVVDQVGGRVSAIFDFDYHHGQVPGRFLVSGTYDAARKSLSLSPGSWLEQPVGWRTVGLTGTVSLQHTIFSGKIDDPHCGAFRLVRQVSDMVAPRCAEGARFVEGHGCVPAPRPGPTAVGSWTGLGRESTGSSWAIQATLRSLESGRCGTVSYPSLSCGGEWYCVKSSEGRTLRAREIITSGQARCDSTGFVEMTLSADGQSAEWRWSSPARATVSTAHLSRSGP